MLKYATKHNNKTKAFFMLIIFLLVLSSISFVLAQEKNKTVTLSIGNTEISKITDDDAGIFEEITEDERVEFLNSLIEEKNLSWVANHTIVSVLTDEEKAQLTGALINIEDYDYQKDLVILQSSSYNYPSERDWRNYENQNWVSPVKNQLSCGSCWAFGVASILEAKINIQLNNSEYDADLSEQHLISCSGAGSCSGGTPATALAYANSTGIAKESCFPYSNANNVCSNACVGWQNHTLKASYIKIESNAQAIKEAIAQYGPVQITYFVDTDFSYYTSGVYSHTILTWDGENHAVSIVGYNDTGEYWIVKNSWGNEWGEEGFFNIAYSENTFYSTWTYSDPRLFFIDTVYAVISTDIDEMPNVTNVQTNVSIAKSTDNINFTVEVQPNSIKNLSSVKLNGYELQGSLTSGGIFTIITNLSSLGCETEEGICNLLINATDDAGLSATLAVTGVSVDDVAPIVTISAPLNGLYFNATSILLNGTAVDGVGVESVWLSIDGEEQIQAEGNESWVYLWENITLGEHKVSVRATDLASNQGAWSENKTFYYVASDNLSPPIIHEMYFLENDLVYSFSPLDNTVNLVVSAEAGDGSGINLSASYANFSSLTTNCGSGSEIIYFDYADDYFNARCNLTNINLQNNVMKEEVIVKFVSNLGNEVQMNSSRIIFHNISYPLTNSSDCTIFGQGTTNMSAELDLNAVNLSLILLRNGSAACNNNQELPWGESFQKIVNLSFTNLNFTDETAIDKWIDFKNNLALLISPPRTFEMNRIYVNVSNFSELNTDALINVYNLPFISSPQLIKDDIGEIAVGSVWNSAYENVVFDAFIGNLTFTSDMAYGYNFTDTVLPLLVNSSTDTISASSDVLFLNFTFNGTGTEISFVKISIVNDTGTIANYTYNSSNYLIDNSANCAQEIFRGEITRCGINLTLGEDSNEFSEGVYYVNISSFDFGYSSGNRLQELTMVSLDNTPPIINIFSPLNNTNATSGNITFSFNITDTSQSIFCRLFIDNELRFSRTNISSENRNISEIFDETLELGMHEWYINCSDEVGYSKKSAEYLFNVTNSTDDYVQYIDSCQTISTPGRYVLNQSILNQNTPNLFSCITINSSNTILDCRGQLISGNVSLTGLNTGVLIVGSNVTVKNCIIKDFFYQIRMYLANTTNVTITNNTLSNARISTTTWLLYISFAKNNYIYLNNFSSTKGGYIFEDIQDIVQRNSYNYTINGVNTGNIYENVMNGSVFVSGQIESSIPGLYSGSGGTGYPYSDATSNGKIDCNLPSVVDYAPLTPNYGEAPSCINLDSANSIYSINDTVNAYQNCFNILENNITLDCRGNSIVGVNVVNSYAIKIRSNNVTVKNCRIFNFSRGIWLDGADYGSITNNTIYSNISGAYGIYIYSSANYNNISQSNITVREFSGIYIQESEGNNVYDSNIFADFFGVTILGGESNKLFRLNITSNRENALVIYGSQYNNISQSNIKSNMSYGVHLYASTNNTISDSNINSTARSYGVKLSLSTNNLFQNNLFYDSVLFNEISSCNNEFTTNVKPDNKRFLLYYNQNNAEIKSINNVSQIIFCNVSNSNISNINISSSGIDCVEFNQGENNLITNVNITCANGLYMWASHNNTISESTLGSNSGYSVKFEQSNYNVLSNSNIRASYEGLISTGSNTQIISSNISSNYSTGVYFEGNNYNIILNSSISSTYSDAVYFLGLGFNNISYSNLISLEGHGLYLYMDSTSNTFMHNNFTSGFVGCTFEDNCRAAIGDESGISNVFLNNTITGEYWVNYFLGAVSDDSFNDSTTGNKYYLLNGTPASDFCNMTTDDSGWAIGGSDVPFSSSSPCLLISPGNSRWRDMGADYHPYVREPSDVSAPGSISNLINVSVGTSWIFWNWSNPLDSDFNKSLLFLNGSNVLNVSGPLSFVNLSGLSSNASYLLVVWTVDHLGNVNSSGVSNVSWTLPLPDVDDTSPSVLLILPVNNVTNNLSNYNFSCNLSDEVQLRNASIYVWNSTNDLVYINYTNISGTYNSSSWIIDIGYADVFEWNCLVYDASNNSAWALTNYTLNQVTENLFCTENWLCSSWSSCSDRVKTRTCEDVNLCGTNSSMPELSESCGSGGSSPGGNNYNPPQNVNLTNNSINDSLNISFGNYSLAYNLTNDAHYENSDSQNDDEDNNNLSGSGDQTENDSLNTNLLNMESPANLNSLFIKEKESIKNIISEVNSALKENKVFSFVSIFILSMAFTLFFLARRKIMTRKEVLISNKQKQELLNEVNKLSDQIKTLNNVKSSDSIFQDLLVANEKYLFYSLNLKIKSITESANENKDQEYLKNIKNKNLLAALMIFINRQKELEKWHEFNVSNKLFDYYLQELRQLTLNTSDHEVQDDLFITKILEIEGDDEQKCEDLLYDTMIYLEHGSLKEAEANYIKIIKLYDTLSEESKSRIYFESMKLFHYLKYAERFMRKK